MAHEINFRMVSNGFDLIEDIMGNIPDDLILANECGGYIRFYDVCNGYIYSVDYDDIIATFGGEPEQGDIYETILRPEPVKVDDIADLIRDGEMELPEEFSVTPEHDFYKETKEAINEYKYLKVRKMI